MISALIGGSARLVQIHRTAHIDGTFTGLNAEEVLKLSAAPDLVTAYRLRSARIILRIKNGRLHCFLGRYFMVAHAVFGSGDGVNPADKSKRVSVLRTPIPPGSRIFVFC